MRKDHAEVFFEELKALGRLPHPSALHELCTLCEGMTLEAINRPYLHIPNVYDIPKSAEACALCAMLISQIWKSAAAQQAISSDPPRDATEGVQEFLRMLSKVGIEKEMEVGLRIWAPYREDYVAWVNLISFKTLSVADDSPRVRPHLPDIRLRILTERCEFAQGRVSSDSNSTDRRRWERRSQWLSNTPRVATVKHAGP